LLAQNPVRSIRLQGGPDGDSQGKKILYKPIVPVDEPDLYFVIPGDMRRAEI